MEIGFVVFKSIQVCCAKSPFLKEMSPQATRDVLSLVVLLRFTEGSRFVNDDSAVERINPDNAVVFFFFLLDVP